MPPTIALLVWFILLLALFYFDPAKTSKTSAALWVPVIWMFIVGSRLPSQWLGVHVGQAAVALQEGNPLDRSVDLVLISCAILVLVSRRFKWADFFTRNLMLMAFVLFALASVLWSDFPFAAFRKWFRDLGNYLVVLVALSDPCPLEAVRTVLRRLGYLLIPLCILLDKYFPNFSKQYDEWSGVGMYVGATTGKNLLGLLAMLAGLFFFWDIVVRWADRRERRTKRILLVNAAFLVMSLSLLKTSDSTTCRVCMLLGCLVIAAAHSKMFKRHPRFLKTLVPSLFALYLILALGLGMSGNLAAAVGKDPTLTDRTKIWAFLLSMHTNPLIGTGYESFWLGPRLQWVWQMAGLGPINEAHNGYLEVYLNLGIIGLCLLGGFLIASYRNICRQLTSSFSLASLNLALWIVMLFYSVTEAGFRSGLMWLVLLLACLAVQQREGHRTDAVMTFNSGSVREPRFPERILETESHRR